VAPATQVASSDPAQLNLDKPIYTISVAAEILAVHPRTLIMYEHLGLVVPYRTPTNRRRYCQRDLQTLQAIHRLTRMHGLNLNAARHVIRLLQTLDAHQIPRPEFVSDIDIAHVRI
jgi:MerR family transcriptional regulator/heat shock protein HspR